MKLLRNTAHDYMSGAGLRQGSIPEGIDMDD